MFTCPVCKGLVYHVSLIDSKYVIFCKNNDYTRHLASFIAQIALPSDIQELVSYTRFSYPGMKSIYDLDSNNFWQQFYIGYTKSFFGLTYSDKPILDITISNKCEYYQTKMDYSERLKPVVLVKQIQEHISVARIINRIKSELGNDIPVIFQNR